VSVSPTTYYIPAAPRFPLTSAITLCTAALQSPRHPRIDCLSDWKVSQHDFPYEIFHCTLACSTSTHSRHYRLPIFFLHANKKLTTTMDFSFDNFWLLTSYLLLTLCYCNFHSKTFIFYWLSLLLCVCDKNSYCMH